MQVPIKKNIYELIEMKSKFIALTFPFNNVDDLDKILSEVKNKYKDARHYLYAYLTSNKAKFDNDNEPGNIAKRILDLFSLMKIEDVLVIVVRYFGGVKLGASNLLRTYVNAANESIKGCLKGNKEEMFQYTITCDYSTFNKIKKAGFIIENVQYFDKIKLDILSKENILDNLKKFQDITIDSKKVNRVNYESSKK